MVYDDIFNNISDYIYNNLKDEIDDYFDLDIDDVDAVSISNNELYENCYGNSIAFPCCMHKKEDKVFKCDTLFTNGELYSGNVDVNNLRFYDTKYLSKRVNEKYLEEHSSFNSEYVFNSYINSRDIDKEFCIGSSENYNIINTFVLNNVSPATIIPNYEDEYVRVIYQKYIYNDCDFIFFNRVEINPCYKKLVVCIYNSEQFVYNFTKKIDINLLKKKAFLANFNDLKLDFYAKKSWFSEGIKSSMIYKNGDFFSDNTIKYIKDFKFEIQDMGKYDIGKVIKCSIPEFTVYNGKLYIACEILNNSELLKTVFKLFNYFEYVQHKNVIYEIPALSYMDYINVVCNNISKYYSYLDCTVYKDSVYRKCLNTLFSMATKPNNKLQKLLSIDESLVRSIIKNILQSNFLEKEDKEYMKSFESFIEYSFPIIKFILKSFSRSNNNSIYETNKLLCILNTHRFYDRFKKFIRILCITRLNIMLESNVNNKLFKLVKLLFNDDYNNSVSQDFLYFTSDILFDIDNIYDKVYESLNSGVYDIDVDVEVFKFNISKMELDNMSKTIHRKAKNISTSFLSKYSLNELKIYNTPNGGFDVGDIVFSDNVKSIITKQNIHEHMVYRTSYSYFEKNFSDFMDVFLLSRPVKFGTEYCVMKNNMSSINLYEKVYNKEYIGNLHMKLHDTISQSYKFKIISNFFGRNETVRVVNSEIGLVMRVMSISLYNEYFNNYISSDVPGEDKYGFYSIYDKNTGRYIDIRKSLYYFDEMYKYIVNSQRIRKSYEDMISNIKKINKNHIPIDKFVENFISYATKNIKKDDKLFDSLCKEAINVIKNNSDCNELIDKLIVLQYRLLEFQNTLHNGELYRTGFLNDMVIDGLNSGYLYRRSDFVYNVIENLALYDNGNLFFSISDLNESLKDVTKIGNKNVLFRDEGIYDIRRFKK